VLEDLDIEPACAEAGLPGILKTTRFGYDGLGQARVSSVAEARAAFHELGGGACILEGVCAFEREASIIAARNADGAVAFYDLSENRHDGGILWAARSPADVSDAIAREARMAAEKVLVSLNYIGVVAIEFFVMADGRLIANEMAPRVHNSGHWTIEGAATSQFEQHVRAIAGWPLGSTDRLGEAEMVNLIGDAARDWARYAAEPGAHLHLYGKRDARAGRKMGHVTRLKPPKGAP
jgi:5-(carboxyamino)imidazole ribonucleotide synthase